MCVSVCVCVFEKHFLIKTYLIKQYRHLLSTYFCFNPFKLSYGCYDIWPELVKKPSIINWFPSTFKPISGHHQGVCILQKQYNLCKCITTL